MRTPRARPPVSARLPMSAPARTVLEEIKAYLTSLDEDELTEEGAEKTEESIPTRPTTRARPD